MQRTNTTKQDVFLIPGPSKAIFDFSRRHNMRITVPKGSKWWIKSHWHNEKSSCECVECIQGQLIVFNYPNSSGGGASGGSEGFRYSFLPVGRHSWSPGDREQDLVVVLTANDILYRNKCSAALDADRFPSLITTPAWLRALFGLTSWWPPGYRWLLQQALWVQFQAIDYAHGYFTLHGALPVARVWRWFHPFDNRFPDWVWETQWYSQLMISRIVECGCFWIGKVVGIRGQYPEYTPQYDQTFEKE